MAASGRDAGRRVCVCGGRGVGGGGVGADASGERVQSGCAEWKGCLKSGCTPKPGAKPCGRCPNGLAFPVELAKALKGVSDPLTQNLFR